MHARARVLVALGLALAGLVAAAGAASLDVPAPAALLDHVRALSAERMEGRQAGTAGADLAADHVARAFAAAGLVPAGEGGTYRQVFSVPTEVRLGQPTTLARLSDPPRPLVLGTDFVPLAVSDGGAITGDVVFVGHGITAPDLGWDDYAGLDVRDRIVLALEREPGGPDPASPFRRPEAFHYGQHAHKLINARQHGARAILLVNHPGLVPDTLPRLRGISQPRGIVAAALTRAAADSLLAPAGQTVAGLASAIEAARAPRSRPLGVRARLEVTLLRERSTTANVIGRLPGRDPQLAAEAIVIGAHYDHLGRGGEGSLAPDEAGAIHHGADDNASGTAAVIALAETFARAGGLPRTLVFVAFGAEEMGLLGSAHYVRQPAWPLARTALMVNFDMVGRLRDGRLHVGGVDSGSGLRPLVTEAARATGLTATLRGDPFAPSDHTSFYTAGRPVLFFFTGAHADYHRPSDTWDKIDAEGLRAVTALAARVVASVAAAPTAPVYATVTAPGSARPRGAYGVFFGVIPLFGERPEPGVAISGVRAASPAERAGLRAGDVIVRFADVEVKTLDDLTFALRAQRPGDRVPVVVQRDGQRRTLETVLEERR